MCSNKRVVVGIGIIVFLCFFINIFYFKIYYFILVLDCELDDVVFDFIEFGMIEGSKCYEFWVYCMFLVLVLWLIIFILNMLIIFCVVRVNRGMFKWKSI